ncbi:BON domain-containing protein [Marinactinospora rubrisoli]|uniref:BON domain-containing protein n=1 Tax=Marinactinospora rubrisoli TaxID=2715399 RepID=A0ABW2KH03_9ACTN
MREGPETEALLTTLKRVAITLKAADVPFALSGSFAAYARGATAPDHDVDFVLLPEDVDRAAAALAGAGLRRVMVAEDWLVKVFDGTSQVDLIYRPSEHAITAPLLRRATPMKVHSIHVPVMDATDLLVMMLRAFTEHHCDYSTPLEVSRALREQVDWDRVRGETADSPYAHAFLVLLRHLTVIGPKEENLMAGEEPQYLAGHLQQALAEDPRTGALGIRVRVHGTDVHLSGELPSTERRRAVLAVARELVPDYAVHDDLAVSGMEGETKEERLA